MEIIICLILFGAIIKVLADWKTTSDFKKRSRKQFMDTLDACNRTQRRIDEERAKANAWKEQYKK